MYQKLYKRSAEKWQKVAIWQKTQKSKKDKKVYILSGPLWYTLTEKPDSNCVFRTVLSDIWLDTFRIVILRPPYQNNEFSLET